MRCFIKTRSTQSHRHGNPRARRGFCLPEIVIVLACAALLLGAAIPAAGRLSDEWTLRGAAHALEYSLRWGRTQAVTGNTSMLFAVDGTGRFYYWADPGGGQRCEGTLQYLPRQVRIVSFPARPLRFFPSGNAAPAGTYVLQGDTGSCRVVVNFAGRIRFQRD